MAKFYPTLTEDHRGFISRQRIFFAASAAATGRVNLSPREAGALRVLGEASVCWLDQTGSGSETAAHLRADGRLTLMFCAFEGAPLILRLYGRGQSLPRGGAEYAEVLAEHYGGEEPLGARQIVRLAVELVQTSCGYGVPMFDFAADRPNLQRWARAKGEDGLEAYRREKNAVSLDGLPTGLVKA
ncbi:pyridoxamine 5'-phosphate oxidase [Siccirubricoccus deserti]|uniref:Pyridoxamine 5'-phosphate oxidase family protein n=1 Tax=Siccirubricoccus deserti TaxID=2013562 RepID=A0A9X0QXT2_9PROT|nr:pyridoxamine 5'-phosphate oxidase family protein [Siccirubricoccus deserti]MBC4015570.1 pyridoxamine 5'-phosphate oxidase family protein [Siccirubricoccus deserti]GGC42770.1 pyridoxamine 5'-phosphate oxidase [Siccirubricoccus deserti]